jgi:hypothetical protein
VNTFNRKKVFCVCTVLVWCALGVYFVPKIVSDFNRSKLAYSRDVQSAIYKELDDCFKKHGYSDLSLLMKADGPKACSVVVENECSRQRCYDRERMVYECMRQRVSDCSMIGVYDSKNPKEYGSYKNYYELYFSSNYSKSLYVFVLAIIELPSIFFLMSLLIPKLFRWLKT